MSVNVILRINSIKKALSVSLSHILCFLVVQSSLILLDLLVIVRDSLYSLLQRSS